MPAPITYPLGHTEQEILRLNQQALMLRDPVLAELAKSASDILEIGAGVGSNWPILREANPNANYLGTDFSEDAIATANATHGRTGARFKTMDATRIDLPEESFDLVISKLVLWSIGPKWETALQEAFRVLKPGGTFYAFEPFDGGVTFSPSKPNLKTLIDQWDQMALDAGLNPLIGPLVPGALQRVGFTKPKVRPFPVVALGSEKEAYFSICKNLRKFYFGDSPQNPGRNIESQLKSAALRELQSFDDGSLVMDFFFSSWATKPM